MPKTATTEQDAPAETPSQTTEELEGAATKAYNEAVANLDAAKAKLAEAGLAGDIDAMVEWATKKVACEAQVKKTQKAVQDAEYNRNSEARMAASLELKAGVNEYVMGLDLEKIYAIGLRGFSVTFNEDFSVNVNVLGIQAPSAAAKATRNAPRQAGTGREPKSEWGFQGRLYSSRELLETFGGEKGLIAVARTRPVSEEPVHGYDVNKLTKNGKPQTNPGFDAELKALARKMGWDGGDRVLTHEPTEG